MNAVPRLLPLALFAVGVTAIVSAACGGNDEKPRSAASSEDLATATATSTPTAAPTSTPTPIPTPTPFNGAISRIKIPKFNVDAPIEELGINSREELDTPKNENKNVGWYYLYDKPGRANPDNKGWVSIGGRTGIPDAGNAVFSAHVYYHSIPAPFVNLAKSQPGDEISVVMENGAEYKYRVISNNRYHRDTIDMGKAIWPKEKPADKEWITMITCGGELDSTGQEYISRDVVIAERYQ